MSRVILRAAFAPGAVAKSGDGGIDGIISEDRLGLDFVSGQALNQLSGQRRDSKLLGRLGRARRSDRLPSDPNRGGSS